MSGLTEEAARVIFEEDSGNRQGPAVGTAIGLRLQGLVHPKW